MDDYDAADDSRKSYDVAIDAMRQEFLAKGYDFHPLANVFPLLDGAEFEALVADVKANGLLEPITTFEGKILDGRNRLRACEAAGIIAVMDEYVGTDPVGFVISKNLKRRHLDESQRAMVHARIARLPKGANQHTAVAVPTQAQGGDAMKARVGKQPEVPTLADAGIDKNLADRARKMAAVPEAKFEAAVMRRRSTPGRYARVSSGANLGDEIGDARSQRRLFRL